MPTIAQRYVPDYPIDELHEHPQNPRRGDLDVLDESLAEHGFYGAVIVQESSGAIIIGNHRTRAARQRGERTVPAFVIDVDDERARRLMLMDNRASDRATNDDRALSELLVELEASAGLVGTGYSSEELAKLVAQLDPEPIDPDDVRDLSQSTEHECPFCAARWVDTAEGPERL